MIRKRLNLYFNHGGRLLAAIVLAGAVMSEGFGDDAGDTAKDLRDDCEQVPHCVDPHDPECKVGVFAAVLRCVYYVSGFKYGHFFGLHEGHYKSTGHEIPDYETLQKHAIVCIPKNASNEQLIEVFLKYINDRPERLHESAANELYNSWKDAFPCE